MPKIYKPLCKLVETTATKMYGYKSYFKPSNKVTSPEKESKTRYKGRRRKKLDERYINPNY